MTKIYVASSWRNEHQPGVVSVLREAGFEVYDFRNPREGNKGFAWSDIDPNWLGWSVGEFREALKHYIARNGFVLDMASLQEADACVVVLPCGRSAHLEAGFAVGSGKPTLIYSPEPHEPELMYSMCADITSSIDEVIALLKGIE